MAQDTFNREREIADLQTVMGLAEGRRLMWRMLGMAGVFRTPFAAGAADVTAFRAGAQNFGFELLGEVMAHDPGGFLTMQQEAMDNERIRRIEEAARAESRSDTDDGLPAD